MLRYTTRFSVIFFKEDKQKFGGLKSQEIKTTTFRVMTLICFPQLKLNYLF